MKTLSGTKSLEEKIAVVAGFSRAGRGIALLLGGCGATVYVAAQATRNGPEPADQAPGKIDDTAEWVTARADLSDGKQGAAVFERVKKEHGHLDIITNSVWSAN